MNLLDKCGYQPTWGRWIPFQIVYADGFYVMLNTNGVFQFSNGLDATNWPGIETEAVSSYGDQTLAINSTHRELWLFSAQKATTYYDAGDNPIPYDEISGGDMEQGIAAPWSVVSLDNTVFWLGANKDGAGIVWRASGYTPLRISNHAVEFALQGYSTFTDAVAYGYQDQGHTFYVLYLPTANKTWVYDCATQMWHERAYGIAGTNETAHRSCSHAYCFGMHIVGDWATGNVYQMSIAQTQDFGNPIRRVRRSPHISNENEWMFFQSLQVDLETGLQPSQLLQGQAQPTIYTFQDSSGNAWNVSITDTGLFQVVPSGNTAYSTIYLNDPANLTTWQLGVSTLGQLITNPATFSPTVSTSFIMNSSTGQSKWVIQVTNLGLLQSTFAATVYRNPTMMMRFSDDAAHTWSNTYTCDMGAPGNYKARVLWRRLGRSRDRVFELTVTDPVPWRIIDGFLKATPGYVPTERLTDRLRKAS